MLSDRFNQLLHLFLEGIPVGPTDDLEIDLATACSVLPTGDTLANLEAFNAECVGSHLSLMVRGKRCRLCFRPDPKPTFDNWQYSLPLADDVKVEQLMLL